jgi:hypothetical protein
MGIPDLPTMAEVAARRGATPKHAVPTKLDRAVAKKAAAREDEQKLAAWALQVKTLDHWKDRKTGQRVTRTRALDPLRAEAHHIVSRSDEAVRYDIRNGLCLSYATHDAVERNQLQIVGTKFFTVGGVRYIDGRAPVTFKEI